MPPLMRDADAPSQLPRDKPPDKPVVHNAAPQECRARIFTGYETQVQRHRPYVAGAF